MQVCKGVELTSYQTYFVLLHYAVHFCVVLLVALRCTTLCFALRCAALCFAVLCFAVLCFAMADFVESRPAVVVAVACVASLTLCGSGPLK